MTDKCSIWLPDAKFTHSAGSSLGATLYTPPLTITLSGELGAGKTTFMQGLLAGLGVDDAVASPTYALEQRYATCLGELAHIDLYRLDESGAKAFIEEAGEGSAILCFEWPERAHVAGNIHIALAEDDKRPGRNLVVTFNDIRLPTDDDILLWRDELCLPPHIAAHCDAVADFALVLATNLLERGMILRPEALRKAAKLHDLLRFVDFFPGASHAGDQEEPPEWEFWRGKYSSMKHEAACAAFLEERGYPELARIVATHGVQLPPSERTTPEQKILYYADKRVMLDTVVSLEERFADFSARYTSGEKAKEGQLWFTQAKQLEEELFPDGPIS